MPDHPVKTRTLPTLPIEEESDLLLTDEEVMNMAETEAEQGHDVHGIKPAGTDRRSNFQEADGSFYSSCNGNCS